MIHIKRLFAGIVFIALIIGVFSGIIWFAVFFCPNHLRVVAFLGIVATLAWCYSVGVDLL